MKNNLFKGLGVVLILIATVTVLWGCSQNPVDLILRDLAQSIDHARTLVHSTNTEERNQALQAMVENQGRLALVANTLNSSQEKKAFDLMGQLIEVSNSMVLAERNLFEVPTE